MLATAFGNSTLNKKNVHNCNKLFTEDQENVNDEAHPGRPSTSTTDENVKAVEKTIMENHPFTIREVAENINAIWVKQHENTQRIVEEPILVIPPW